MSEIRHLLKDELPLCLEHGKAFHKEFNLAGSFVPEVFIRNWNIFYERNIGTVLTLWDDRHTLIGGLGGLLAPDLFDARLCASEIFWFVAKEHRAGSGALRLLKAYEDWAFEQGAVEARLVFLKGGVADERLEKVYRKMGYREREIGFYKPLVNFSELTWPS